MTKGIRSQVCHLKGHLFELGLVNRLGVTDASRHLKQPHSFILCDYEVLATLIFRHLGYHCMKLGHFEDISVSWILHVV